jgi:hypothetical protein
VTSSVKWLPSFQLKALALLGIFLLLWLGRFAWDYFDPNSPANLAMQDQLKMFGSAMYECHAQTGRWPTRVDDLSQTSLPTRSHVWRQTANSILFLWPQKLDSQAKNNSQVLLMHWEGGLFNSFGRVWVCWGDLRTEHVKKSRVRTGQVDSALGSESHHLLSPRLDNRAQSFSSLRSSSASGRPVDLFCLVEQCFN